MKKNKEDWYALVLIIIIFLVGFGLMVEKVPEEETKQESKEEVKLPTRVEEVKETEFDYDHYLLDWYAHIGDKIQVEGTVIQVLEGEGKVRYLLLIGDLEEIDYNNPKRIIAEESQEQADKLGFVQEGDRIKVEGIFTGMEHMHTEDDEEVDIFTMEIDELE